MIGESRFTMEMAEWIWDFFNNASFESPVYEASKESVNEQADHVSPMVVKAYKEYLQAKKDGDGEKAYRYYSKKLNNTYSTRADRDAIEAILKKKYGNTLEEAKVDYDFSERELIRVIRQLKRGASTEIDMIKAFTKALGRDITKDELFSEAISKMNEASKEEETEFHKKLDKLVHDTFGKRKGELEEAELNEAAYSEYADLIDLVQKADNPRNLPIYYNSDFGAVNIGGVGYDKGELVNKFNGRKSGMDSIDIKTIFYKANQNPEQTAKDVNSLNMGVKAEVDYGYGKEPFIKFTKGYSERRERGLEEIKQRVFNKLKK